MSMKIVVNLPVKDLGASIDFFTKLGFPFNERFTDEKAGCMVISDSIHVMLMAQAHFATFTTRELVDATRSTEVIMTLRVDSRRRVDELVETALAAGGQIANDPDDQGFLYVRSFQDLDGHLWDAMYVDTGAA